MVRRMASTTTRRSATHGALTFDLLAKCSVRLSLCAAPSSKLWKRELLLTYETSLGIDYKSSRLRPHPTSWPG